MKFFEKKDFSLANEIKRVITARILLSLGILLIGIFVVSILNIASSFEQIKKNVDAQCFILSEFTISQSLIDNESAIQLNLNTINADNRFIYFQWIKDKKAPPAGEISWKFPFSWTEYYPIISPDGESFGYFKVSGSLLYDSTIISSVLMKIGIVLSFGFIIFLLLYPLGNRIPDRIFVRPVMALLGLLKSGLKEESSTENHTNTQSAENDSKIAVEILEIKSKVIQMLKEAEIHSREVAFGEIAAKVAHDIRSPLAALNMILKKNKTALPEEDLSIIQNATQRINDIANNLLNKKRHKDEITPDVLALNPIKPELALFLLKNIVSEKKAQYTDHKIQFSLEYDDKVKNVFVNVNADELNRAVSNLVNNSVEAIVDRGTVKLMLSKISDNQASFSIVDTGKGLKQEQLETILKNSLSVGKKNGSGIGLSSAIQSIESWGGTFSITSQFGEGTRVEFILPTVAAPTFYEENPDFIFIDDSVYLSDAWKAQAKVNKQTIVVFNTVDLMNHYISYFTKDTPLYIDSNLGHKIKGEVLAKELHDKGFKTIYLCTGMDDGDFPDMPWIKKIVGKDYPKHI